LWAIVIRNATVAFKVRASEVKVRGQVQMSP